jgi:hypothetical protein
MIQFLKRLIQRRYVYRDAVSGEYVSQAYAEAHPATTIRQRVA